MQRSFSRLGPLEAAVGGLSEAPAVALLGARQVGKTTLSRTSSVCMARMDFDATQRGAELDLLLLRHGRRWGFAFNCTDAPRTTKSMHVVAKDLGLEHLWVLYPGDQEYPLTDTMTALPLKNVHTLELRPAL